MGWEFTPCRNSYTLNSLERLKQMKKLFIGLALFATLSVASAQNFIRQSFLNNCTITLTNVPTYVTNVLDNSGLTNLTTILVTNLSTGTNYTTNSTVTVQTVQPFKDVPFIVNGPNATGYLTGATTNSCIEMGLGFGQGAATNGVVAVFVPLISGSEPGSGTSYPAVEDTGITALFVTNQLGGSSASNGVWTFPVNLAAYPGHWGLRLQKLFFSQAVVTADQLTITNISLNGWRP